MLEENLLAAVARERDCLAEVLRGLREVERNKIYLARGYSSLFAYCTEKLGYSEPEAMTRIQAMRLARVVPEALERLGRGTMSLTVAALIGGAVKREKLGERARDLVKELGGCSKREAEKKLAELFPSVRPRERVKPISEDLVELRFTVSREEAEMVERLLDRKSHSNFERSLAKLFMGLARKEIEKLKGKQREDALPHGPAKVRSRYIPASTRRQVWKRDEGLCQYRDPETGQRCQTKHGLQLDHIKAYAEGGSHASENLRLFCGAHNRGRLS